MPFLKISASFATEGTMPRDTSLATSVSEEVMKQLVPGPISGGAAGWGHMKMAEELVCPLLGRKLFPDEVTSIDRADDLRRLGVWYLKVKFHDEQENSNSVTFINDKPQEVE